MGLKWVSRKRVTHADFGSKHKRVSTMFSPALYHGVMATHRNDFSEKNVSRSRHDSWELYYLYSSWQKNARMPVYRVHKYKFNSFDQRDRIWYIVKEKYTCEFIASSNIERINTSVQSIYILIRSTSFLLNMHALRNGYYYRNILARKQIKRSTSRGRCMRR